MNEIMEVTPDAKVKNVCFSPEQQSQREHKEKLSTSLKERLKRTRRSFIAPSSVAKRLCVDEADGQGPKESEENGNKSTSIMSLEDAESNMAQSSKEGSSVRDPQEQNSTCRREQLHREVKDKTETLRRLKMVKMYRSKNDLTQLQTLIDKWRSCAQAALYELQSHVPINGEKAELSDLLDLFGLDPHFLHFDRASGDFTT